MSADGTDAPLPEFDDRARPDRFCDLILTGGVTSAIAYPAAIFALAQVYRFNALGGSSSGAGSAALAAAAEYRRRHGSAEGFRTMLRRTAAVADPVAGRPGLAWLFQPRPAQRRLFKALVPGVAAPVDRAVVAARAILGAYALPLLVGAAAVLVGLALVRLYLGKDWDWGWGCCLVHAFAAALGALAVGLGCFVHDLCALARRDFGLCDGLTVGPHAPHPALTTWLHELVQEIAGRGPDDRPLTFADLASAPGSPRAVLADTGADSAEAIALRMFTANVTLGRPVLFPLQAHDPPLYFLPSEWRRLFPEAVVQHLIDHAPVPAADPGVVAGEPLLQLPLQELPIVVAARMSVGFPVLFSAVPLWTHDEPQHGAALRRCLFADGGLCSNFPIHLFDSPVPAWPTFGIALFDLPPGAVRGDGATELLDDADLEPLVLLPDAAGGFPPLQTGLVAPVQTNWPGFLGAMFSTVKDWNDSTLARLPGVRERVVRVGLPHGIGGLNILMSSTQIRNLARLGKVAALRLIRRYAEADGPDGLAAGWKEHRWLRFTRWHQGLAQALRGLAWSATQAPYAQPIVSQTRAAVDAPPLAPLPRSRLLPAQAAALEGVLAALAQTEGLMNNAAVPQPERPEPPPSLRVRPPL